MLTLLEELKYTTSIFNILNDIESKNKLVDKFQLLLKFKNELYDIFYLCYQYDRNYYIKVSDDYQKNDNKISKTSFEKLTNILNDLNNRKVTGNSARNITENFLNDLSYEEEKWYRRIINRNLRLGISTVTIKSVYPELFPTIKVQSPKEYDEKLIPENMILEPKIDGIRCITFISENNIECFSRNGLRLTYVENLFSSFSFPIKNIILDGELFYKSWNNSMSIVSSGKEIEKIKYYIFDTLTNDEYNSEHSDILLNRKLKLEKIFSKFNKNDNIILTEYSLSSNRDDIIKYYNNFLKNGFEGLMIKDANGKYEFKRSSTWLRIKERSIESYLCIGYHEGTGKNRGKMGSLILQIGNNQVKVGSGFKDKDRINMFNEPPIGKMIDVYIYKSEKREAIAITPIFIRIREDIS